MPDAPGTERLWITEPDRRTSLSEVVEVRGSAFRLDRTLFHPKTRAYAHPQRRDRGTAWIQGKDKHDLATVYERGGDVWHRLDGATPPEGEDLQCHLDVPHREQVERAHTAMHLFLSALWDRPQPVPLARDPEVKGGGTFRLELDRGYARPDEVKDWLDRANTLVDRGLAVSTRFVARDEARDGHAGVDEQLVHGRPSYPGPGESLRVADVEEGPSYPCDGTHVERTDEVGRIVVVEAQPRSDGSFLLVGKTSPG